MRELIRPTLFIIARTSLFLAVVAWIVGQWWMVKFNITYGIGANSIMCHPSIWVVICWTAPSAFDGEWKVTFSHPRFGVDWSSDQRGGMPYVVIPHWQIVVCFALIYILLRSITVELRKQKPVCLNSSPNGKRPWFVALAGHSGNRRRSMFARTCIFPVAALTIAAGAVLIVWFEGPRIRTLPPQGLVIFVQMVSVLTFLYSLFVLLMHVWISAAIEWIDRHKLWTCDESDATHSGEVQPCEN